MSDLENELLGLAEDDPGRRRKRGAGSGERRSKSKSKAFIDSDEEGDDGEGEADMDLESEEDEEPSKSTAPAVAASSSRVGVAVPRQRNNNTQNKNPYPLEGKYIDEDDRDRLDAMPEIERENILATRLEEMQKFKDSQNLDALFKSSGHVRDVDDDDDDDDDDDEGPSKKKRKHTSVTKEASRAITDLKNKRKAKDERVQRRAARRERHPRSLSPSSDQSTEDGEIPHSQSQSYSNRKSPPLSPVQGYKVPSPKKSASATDLNAVPANRQELNSARLSRYEMVEMMGKDGFEDVAAGAYVKLIAGEMDPMGRPKYRIHKIVEIQQKAYREAYPIEYKGRNIMEDRGMLCQYGKVTRLFRLGDASNADFDEGEFSRFSLTNNADGVKAPRRSELKAKHEEIKQLRDRPMTDDEINKQISSRRQNNPAAQRSALFKISQLIQSRDLALRRSDFQSVESLNDQIKEAGGDPKTGQLVFDHHSSSREASGGGDDYDSKIQRINENNKKKTKEQMMKAHTAALQRKKAEEAIVRAKSSASNSPAPDTIIPKAKPPPSSGLRKGETPQQYLARTQSIDLDLGDF